MRITDNGNDYRFHFRAGATVTSSNGGNTTYGSDTSTGVLDLNAEEANDVYARFAKQVAAHCRRLGVNPNELDKRGEQLAERVAAYVKTL